MNEFFRCVAEAVLENGIKGLAGMVIGGPYVYAVGESAIKKYRERRRDKQQHADFLELANVKLEDARIQVVQIVNDAVAKLPASALPSDDEIIDLVQYISCIPDAVRQSLKRPEDPTGTSLPVGFALNSANDIVKVLPARLPRFKANMIVPHRPALTLVRLLGMGGFGEVWYVRHDSIRSLSGAIKFCFDKNGRDLIHEADLIDRVMAAKHHPNIVPLKDAHLEGDTPWLLFEYVGGGCLTDSIHSWAALANEQRLPKVLAAIEQLVQAIAHVHLLANPIVHRDLKPSNILRDEDNHMFRVTDFGIGSVTAKEMNLLESRGQSTQGGRLLSYMRGSHTPTYSSPQQRRGDDADPRDDVHALGVIAYQMLTGKLDSGPGTGASRALKRMTVPDEIAELILSCASEELEDRPANAAVLLKQLRALGKPETIRVPEIFVPLVAAPVPAVDAATEYAKWKQQVDELKAKAMTSADASDYARAVELMANVPVKQRDEATMQLWAKKRDRLATVWSQVESGWKELHDDELVSKLEEVLSLHPEHPRAKPWLAQFGTSDQRRKAKIVKLKAGDRLEIPLPGGQKMAFAYCPAGSFRMGSPATEKVRSEDETQHKVTLSSGYYMGVHPVTRGQFAAFIAKSNYKTEAETLGGGHMWAGKEWKLDPACNWRNPGFAQTDDHPVCVVSHNDALAFTKWLTSQPNQPHAVRLPTEAEWEYAARGGTTTPYYFGSVLSGEQANCDGNHPYGTTTKGPYLEKTTAVGAYAAKFPHPWGLADVHGNVWEWCADWYEAEFYKRSTESDPMCVDGVQTYRVLRGGSWNNHASSCRAANRSGDEPAYRGNSIGFRLCFSLGR